MNIKKFYDKYSYRYVNTILLCAISSLYINELLGFILPPVFILLCLLFFTSLMVFIDAFKKKFVLFIIAITCFSIFVVILQVASLPLFQMLSESFTWMFHSRNPEELNALRNAVFSAGFTLAALVAFIFKIICFYRVRFTVGFALLITTIVLAVVQKPIGNLLLFLLFFFLLSIFLEFILGKEKAITHLLPFVLVVTIIITVIPYSDQGIPWERVTEPTAEFFGRTTRRISDFLPWGRSTEFGVSFIGYTDDGRLRGQVRLSEGEALSLTGRRPYSSLFLTGTIMDTYTGAGWERRQNMNHFDYDEIKLEALEFMLVLYALDALSSYEHLSSEDEEMEWIAQWLETRELNIEFLDIRTTSIFHPLRTFSLTSNSRMDLTGSTLFFTRPQERGTHYTLRHLSVNYRHKMFQELLSGAKPDLVVKLSTIEEINPGEFFTFFNRIPGVFIPSFSIPSQHTEILDQRRELIYHYYTALPASIPERVYLLAREITEDYSSNYEKMLAIERFFTTNHFTYTTVPPPIPEGDFVDWFVFEGTAGYCTYFATAAAVLGRSIGIPVRYVQGFAIPASERGEITVRNRHAHAWIEAYIEPIGWIPFEPTPTFGSLRGDAWGEGGQRGEPSGSGFGQRPFDFHYGRESGPEPGEEEDEILEEERVYLSVIVAALILLLVIIIGLILSWVIYFLKGKRKFQSASAPQRFKWLFKEILYLLELQGHSMSLGETLREFSNRFKKEETSKALQNKESSNEFQNKNSSNELKDKELDKIVALHEKVIYEKKSISLEELEVASQYRDHLVKGLEKKTHLKILYWFYLSR